MHTAYRLNQLLKLPLTIECLTSFQDHLLVGTKQGHLLMYSVKTNGQDSDRNAKAEPKKNDNQEPRVQLLRTNKFFSKKAILHIEAVPEYSILIALCDNLISVHDMDLAVTNFPCISTVDGSKGATAFALDLVRQKSLTGEENVAVRMVVAVKRKLQFYYWKNRKFHQLYTDVTVPDIPKSIAWCRDSVCVGFRGEYNLIKMNQDDRKPCELFPTGKNQEASVTLLSDERFALKKDERTTFINLNGNMNLKAVNWSEVPVALAHDSPYLLAVLSKCVEVKTDEPRLSIQTIELPSPRFISTCKQGLVYVASQTHIWCLQMVSVSVQVPQLLRDKQFELAVTLSSISEDSLDDKTKRVQQIQTLYAFDLFCNHKFKDSMDVFYQLDVDTSHVIGLFTDLLPQEFRNRLRYPDTPPVLQGRELENAIEALVGYLTEVRHRLNGLTVKAIAPLSIMEGCEVITSKRQMMEVLDTTLLKCYLKTNDALVAPLLRLTENRCHMEETEGMLERNQKFSELVIFYNTKGEHRKALTLLKEQHDKPESSLSGRMKSVQYMQNLGPDYIDVICEFAKWILDEDQSDGLAVFTEDMIEVESLPRAKVLDFLLKNKTEAVIPYLEHIISEWKETNCVFHNALILQYKDEIIQMMRENHGEEERVSEFREKLKEFLLTSKHFKAELVLPQFPPEQLQLERAILFGSLNRHKDALVLFIYQLRDVSSALRYCLQHYKPGSEVYTNLFKLLLEPPEDKVMKDLGIKTNTSNKARFQPNVETALTILREHGNKVELLTALKCLPDSVAVKDLAEFLTNKLRERVSQRHHTQVLRGLLHAEHLQVQEQRIALQAEKIQIGEFDICRVCHKRFNNQGAFVRLPNGEIVHFSCQDKALFKS